MLNYDSVLVSEYVLDSWWFQLQCFSISQWMDTKLSMALPPFLLMCPQTPPACKQRRDELVLCFVVVILSPTLPVNLHLLCRSSLTKDASFVQNPVCFSLYLSLSLSRSLPFCVCVRFQKCKLFLALVSNPLYLSTVLYWTKCFQTW